MTNSLELPKSVTLAYWDGGFGVVVDGILKFRGFDSQPLAFRYHFAVFYGEKCHPRLRRPGCRRCETGLNDYCNLGGGFGNIQAGTLEWPMKPFGAFSRCVFHTTSRFAQTVSTTTI
jgi:hypothetical protein